VAALHPVVVRWRGEAERAMREFALDINEGLVAEDDGGGGDDDDDDDEEYDHDHHLSEF
jgi:hypothetical protein